MGSQDLQQARYDQLVRRVGALYGGGSKVVEVLPELFPVIEVENTTPELIALSGWRTAWQSTTRPRDVGAVSTSQLSNPAGSGVIVSVTQVMIQVDLDTAVQSEIGNVIIGTPVSGLWRDGRFGVPRNSTAQASSADGVAVGGGLRLQMATGEEFSLRDDNGIVVLSPGTTLDVATTSFNIVMTVNYWWRERLAQTSELLFP